MAEFSKYHFLCDRIDAAIFSKRPQEEIAREVAAITEEAGAVLRQVGPETDESEIYCLLDTLGYAPDPEAYSPLIEKYLDGPNENLADKALRTLCYFYDVTDQYIDMIVEFMRGVPWDQFDDLRSTGIFVAGTYLKEHAQPALLRELIRIAENQQESENVRDWAWTAIFEAMEKPDPRTAIGRLLSHKQMNAAIMRAAKERLKAEEAAAQPS